MTIQNENLARYEAQYQRFFSTKREALTSPADQLGTLCIMKSTTHKIEAFGDYWINSAILRAALFRTRSTAPTQFKIGCSH